eukprot:3465533-Rhodomonas_salina.2
MAASCARYSLYTYAQQVDGVYRKWSGTEKAYGQDGYAFWQPPNSEDGFGECIGRWTFGQELAWALAAIGGLLGIGGCSHVFFNALDKSIELGKRRSQP